VLERQFVCTCLNLAATAFSIEEGEIHRLWPKQTAERAATRAPAILIICIVDLKGLPGGILNNLWN